jgi:hypothetical protein
MTFQTLNRYSTSYLTWTERSFSLEALRFLIVRITLRGSVLSDCKQSSFLGANDFGSRAWFFRRGTHAVGPQGLAHGIGSSLPRRTGLKKLGVASDIVSARD